MINIPLIEYFALAWFLTCWIGSARYARRHRWLSHSLVYETHRFRMLWIQQMIRRNNRIMDSQIINGLRNGTSFFASTSVFIVAGIIAIMGAADQTIKLVTMLPFATAYTPEIFELKAILFSIIFIYAFFKFTWALRQYNMAAIMLGAAPEHKQFPDDVTKNFVEKLAILCSMAARNFHRGLRAYYFALAALIWFINSWLFMLATALVVVVQHRREFRSRTLQLISEIKTDKDNSSLL